MELVAEAATGCEAIKLTLLLTPDIALVDLSLPDMNGVPARSVQNLPLAFVEAKGVRRIGVRLGNWLTADQGRSLLLNSHGDSLRSKRNYAILALLIGCGLRCGELLALSAASIQLREDDWVIVDLHGKPGYIRTYQFHSGQRRRSIVGLKQVELRTAVCLERSASQERSGAKA